MQESPLSGNARGSRDNLKRGKHCAMAGEKNMAPISVNKQYGAPLHNARPTACNTGTPPFKKRKV